MISRDKKAAMRMYSELCLSLAHKLSSGQIDESTYRSKIEELFVVFTFFNEPTKPKKHA